MIIRPATLKDLPSILAIETQVFPSPWNESHFLYELKENPYSFLFVAEEANQVVGYIDWWLTFQQGQINNLAVHPQLTRKKIGSTLLEDALKRLSRGGAEQVTLEVRISNLPAQHLYHRFGFSRVLTKPRYYADGEDAYVMMRLLPYE